ncbi:MAG: tRNA (adenosine(37)-N6)-threonylcarbamoyltransferase complex dimerization subunit type 1 TsaB [Christensenellales bacterium]
MNVLILNTVFDTANYIVLKDNEVFECDTFGKNNSNETMLVSIDKVLNDAQISIKDIDIVAINKGPGSFTGIRVGMAFAKGIMEANGAMRAVDFNSFEPILERVSEANEIVIEDGISNAYVCKVENGKISSMKYESKENCCENAHIFNKIYSVDEIVDCVKQKIEEGKFLTAGELEPYYLKLSQAEEQLLQMQTKSVPCDNGEK